MVDREQLKAQCSLLSQEIDFGWNGGTREIPPIDKRASFIDPLFLLGCGA